MTASSSQALYHAIPQAPVAANLVLPPPDSGLDGDDVANEDDNLNSSLRAVTTDTWIRWIHFILGCAVLLPWNVVITASPYFLSRLSGSPYKPTFSSYMTTSITALNFLVLAHATATSKKAAPSRRTRLSMLWILAMTVLLTLSTYFHVTPGLFVVFVLTNGMIQAAAGSYLQTAVIQIASLFGPPAVQAMMSGQAAVAVAVSGVQVVSAIISVWDETKESIAVYVSDGSAEERSAFMFFALSALFMGVSIGAHTWLVNMPVYKAIAGHLEQPKSLGDGDAHERQGLMSRGPSQLFNEKTRILHVARVNVVYEVAVAYVFMVTLAVYPPITTSIHTTNPSIHPLLFSAVHFLVFNVGDFLGRYICSFPSLLIWSANRLLTLSASRTLFIPLFLMCNVQRPSSSSTVSSSPIISSDLLFMFILLAFGLSNGYVSSLCMMSAPSLEHNSKLEGRQEDVDVAATVASFCLMGGLALGSIASFAVRFAICGCNPFIS